MELTDDIRAAIKAQLTATPQAAVNPARQRRTSSGLWARPFASDALGVNPTQIEAARAALRARGITADFDKSGRCVVTSDKQYREVAKAVGIWNGRDGYGIRREDGERGYTGREAERAKQELRKAVLSGQIDW